MFHSLIQYSAVNLKYITSNQVLEAQYEGTARRFAVANIASTRPLDDEISDITKEVEELSVNSTPKLWTVGWDVSVSIVEKKHPVPLKVVPSVDYLATAIYTSVSDHRRIKANT